MYLRFFAHGYSSPSYLGFFLINTILHLNTLGNLRSFIGFHENNVKVDQSPLNMNFLLKILTSTSFIPNVSAMFLLCNGVRNTCTMSSKYEYQVI